MLIHQLVNELGGYIFSTTLSTEPRNTTQKANRKTVKKRKLELTSLAPPQSDLERLTDAHIGSSTPVHTVVISGNSQIAFVYTVKQLKDIELFCSNANDNNSCVLGIDATFKLCNIWIIDTFTAISDFSATRREKIKCIQTQS